MHNVSVQKFVAVLMGATTLLICILFSSLTSIDALELLRLSTLGPFAILLELEAFGILSFAFVLALFLLALWPLWRFPALFWLYLFGAAWAAVGFYSGYAAFI